MKVAFAFDEKGGDYETLTKCVTQPAAETLKKCATDKYDKPRLSAFWN